MRRVKVELFSRESRLVKRDMSGSFEDGLGVLIVEWLGDYG